MEDKVKYTEESLMIVSFLKENGFNLIEPMTYANDFLSVELQYEGNSKEMVICFSNGYAVYCPNSFYYLLGFLIDHRIIGFNYKK